MPNDLIDDEAFEFFTEAKSLRQQCHLLATELAELHGELKDSRGKLAPLVLMWFGVSREAARAESELPQTKVARMEVYVVGVMYLKTRGKLSLHQLPFLLPLPSPDCLQHLIG
jgi:hypothetical protein